MARGAFDVDVLGRFEPRGVGALRVPGPRRATVRPCRRARRTARHSTNSKDRRAALRRPSSSISTRITRLPAQTCVVWRKPAQPPTIGVDQGPRLTISPNAAQATVISTLSARIVVYGASRPDRARRCPARPRRWQAKRDLLRQLIAAMGEVVDRLNAARVAADREFEELIGQHVLARDRLGARARPAQSPGSTQAKPIAGTSTTANCRSAPSRGDHWPSRRRMFRSGGSSTPMPRAKLSGLTTRQRVAGERRRGTRQRPSARLFDRRPPLIRPPDSLLVRRVRPMHARRAACRDRALGRTLRLLRCWPHEARRSDRAGRRMIACFRYGVRYSSARTSTAGPACRCG